METEIQMMPMDGLRAFGKVGDDEEGPVCLQDPNKVPLRRRLSQRGKLMGTRLVPVHET